MTDILAVNGGSSGLKFALYRMDAVEHMVFSGALDRIGLGAGTLRVHDGDGQIITAQPLDLPDQASALAHMLAWLAAHDSVGMLDAVGHRVAHGGERFRGPTLA
nr:acetate/propionate family kinase [Ktedonobacterales bacterium]